MKKLFLFSVLLVAALFSTNAFAYKVYINDPCSQGRPGAAWNANRIDKIGAVIVSSTPWPAWFYDAQGQIFGPNDPETTRVEGLSVVESYPFRVEAEGELFFSMDIYALTLQASNMRNFGVRMRLNAGNEWDTLYAMRPQGGNFPAYNNGYGGTLEVPVGDKYNGKNVVLQIFFYNDPLANDAFIMAFTNVFMASYNSESSIRNELASRPFVYGDTYEVILNGFNQSTTPITSIEYAYIVNGNAEKKQTATFTTPLKGRGTATFSFALDITDADIDTTNRVQIWPVAINGETYVAEDSLDFLLTVVDEDRLDQDYVPMLECFTSATCQPCRQLNPYLNPVLVGLKEDGKINVVKYQVNWPSPGDRYYIVGNSTRVSYYGVTAAPTLVLNGTERPLEWDAATYNALMNQLRNKVNADAQNKSFFNIKVNKAKVTNDAKVELDFDVTSHLPGVKAKRMLVYAMVIEGSTQGNKVVSTESNFHYVNMAFATESSGESDYFLQDESNNYTYTVDMNKTNVEELEDLQVVIFVQDPSDKYIYQSAGVVMGEGAAVEGDAALAQVSLYPNPATGMVHVAGLEKARVEIFDLTGRKLYETVDASDVLEVSLASFAKGTYVVRISQKGAVTSHKLVVK